MPKRSSAGKGLNKSRLVAVAATVGLVFFFAPTASDAATHAHAAPATASCSLSNHCYGMAQWKSSPTTTGSNGYLYAECMHVNDPSTNFLDQEMWQGTDNSNTGLYWVETGGTIGVPEGNVRYWFWADNRPGHGYYQHFPSGSLNLDQYYYFSFNYNGGDDWDVGGPWGNGTSTANPPSGKYLAAGTEITENANRSVGTISSLSYLNSSGDTVTGWSGASTVNIGGDTTTSWVGSGHTEVSFKSSC